MVKRRQLCGEPSPRHYQGTQRFRSGVELSVFEEEKEGQSGCEHVNEVDSRVMRSRRFRGPDHPESESLSRKVGF